MLCLPPALTLVSCSVYSSTLKMEAIYSSDTSVEFQRTTSRFIPEGSTLHNHRCENLKSCILCVESSPNSTVQWLALVLHILHFPALISAKRPVLLKFILILPRQILGGEGGGGLFKIAHICFHFHPSQFIIHNHPVIYNSTLRNRTIHTIHWPRWVAYCSKFVHNEIN
jgi:hypothetical protein